MKKILLVVIVSILFVFLLFSGKISGSDISQAKEFVWIHTEGFSIGDIIVFEDSLVGYHQIDSFYRITKKGVYEAKLISASKTKLIIQVANGDARGYYKPYQTYAKFKQDAVRLKKSNAELNKKEISRTVSGIVTSKQTMSNGCLELRFNNQTRLASCWFGFSSDSIQVGDSVYKRNGENLLYVYRKEHLPIVLTFINPNDTIP